ncbi:leucine--tRNA ligase [Candidatus Woesebacteria bacterium]|nr:leucine--tRNA ligase [Candidatus Woesebacteria bacterium]
MGRHPAEQAQISEENFYRQLGMIGNGFAWDHRLETYDQEYYRWTQWLFAEMFRHGLAYQAEAKVNWCPNCKTVLADEQVEDGQCERCKTEVVRREMTSWYLKITEYADRLLDNIDHYEWTDAHGEKHVGLDWPKKVTIAQKNWIGRSTGLDIDFAVSDESPAAGETITVWTKFWETVFGVTYLVLAPEHELVEKMTTAEQQAVVAEYLEKAQNKTEQERKENREKTGVFTGSYVINPVNGQKVPVWVADYVLTDVGTGAVMGVPAHDSRDFEFAKKYDFEIIQVVAYEDAEINAAVAQGERSHEGEGSLVNSGDFSGQDAWGAGKQAMKDWMIEQGFARIRTDYHLRDWLISRQRYWGPPIPMVFSEEAAKQGIGEVDGIPGWFAAENDSLPVVLPHLDEYKPEGDGTSPLDNAPEDWKKVQINHPKFQGEGVRETNVSDTFLDSAWYFLRYPALNRADANETPFGQVNEDPSWFPVDAYIGGAEHAVLHLLYARFITMVLYDWGLVPFEEPFPFLFGHGLIIKDGAKMSKSRGNVVNPDEYIQKYGADALRTYLMFLGPYDQGGDFRDSGMHAMYKWLARVWETVKSVSKDAKTDADFASQLHQTIAANTSEMAQLKYNTCIARLMELVNLWREGKSVSPEDAVAFLQLLAPFAPYMTEALYQDMSADFDIQTSSADGFTSIHTSAWPAVDESKIQTQSVVIAVQVNGKLRDTMTVPTESANDKAWLESQARELPLVQKYLEEGTERKVIVVPGKIVNFVVA